MTVVTDDAQWLRSPIGSATPDTITVRGRNLPSEAMGRLTLTELAYLLIVGREATEAQRRMLDVVLVSLADHGLTPSALSARLTFTGAPEAPQAAVAAGLLSAGSVFLGPTGDTTEFLAEALTEVDGDPDAEALHTLALSAVERLRATGRRVPGLGHPCTRTSTPPHRTPVRARRSERGARPAPTAAAGRGRRQRRAGRPTPADQRRRGRRRRPRRHRHPPPRACGEWC